jgi:uncharacterized protein YkwD
MAIFILVVFVCVAYSVIYYKKKIESDFDYTPEYNHNLNDNEVGLLRLINQHLINLGLGVVQPEVLASEVCYDAILNDIANDKGHNHNGFENRLRECKAKHGGEICNSNIHTPLGFFMEYLKSKTHRECIENKNYTHLGISLIENRNYIIFTKY